MYIFEYMYNQKDAKKFTYSTWIQSFRTPVDSKTDAGTNTNSYLS